MSHQGNVLMEHLPTFFYSQAILHRRTSFSTAIEVELPIDTSISKIKIALYGSFTSAILSDPSGESYRIATTGKQEDSNIRILINSPLFTLVSELLCCIAI